MSFGERLRKYRELQRYTQKGIAEQLDIGLSTYNKYEKDEYQPKFDTLLKICRILNVSPNTLLGYNGVPIMLENFNGKILEEREDGTRVVSIPIPSSDNTIEFSMLEEDLFNMLDDINDDCADVGAQEYINNQDLAFAKIFLKYLHLMKFRPRTNSPHNSADYPALIRALLKKYPHWY